MHKFFAALAIATLVVPLSASAEETCAQDCISPWRTIDSVHLDTAGWYLTELRIPKDAEVSVDISGTLDPAWRYQWASVSLFDADGFQGSYPSVWTNADSGIRLRADDVTDVTITPGFLGGEDNEVNGVQSMRAERTGRFQLLVTVAADAPISDLQISVEQHAAAPSSKRIDLFGSWHGNDIQAIFPSRASAEAAPVAWASAKGTMNFSNRVFAQSNWTTVGATAIDSPAGRWLRAGSFVLDGGPLGEYRFDSSTIGYYPLALVGVDLPVPLPYY
jgi:hypothetical protein